MSKLIENLSTEAKKELAKALWTKREAKKSKYLDTWNPWTCRHNGEHTSQTDPFKSKARRRLVLGGNRSGKTEMGAADITHMFLGTHPYRENRVPCVIKVCGKVGGIRNAILPKIMKFLPKSSIQKLRKDARGFVSKIIGVNQSVIDILTYDQDPESFEAFDADVAWFDEPPPYYVWEGIRRGLIDRQGTELFTSTPLSEPWIYEKFYLPALEGTMPGTEVFELWMSCSPYVSLEEIEQVKEDYPDEETQNARLYGKFRHLEGAIYKFNRNVHIISMFEWPRHWPVYMAIDPHPKKPHAVSWIGVTKEGIKVIIDEMKEACTINELASKILVRESQRKYRIVDRLIDTSIKAIDRIDQKRLLADAGIKCRYPHKYDRVLPGIEKVQQLLHPTKNNEGKVESELVVRENCKGHIKEFMTYMWADTGDKPVKKNDDYMDNVRYICDTNPQFQYSRKPIPYVKGTYGENIKKAKAIQSIHCGEYW